MRLFVRFCAKLIYIYEEKDKNANLICAKAADELLTISNITASFVMGDTGDKITSNSLNNLSTLNIS